MSSARSKAVAQKNHFSNLEFIMSLNKYIPSLVLQQLIMREQSADKSTKLPELQPMETVVIFADISGFTNLGEACAEKGPRGNEELAFCINRYMEGMVTNLNQYGGDIIKFVGDAMIVMWPPINRQLSNWQETRNDTIRRAIQCGQDIQKHMNNLQMLPGVTLSVKIGIGYGTCALLYVGGVFGRSESFTIGEALIQALRSEGQADGGGQIIVAEACYNHVREYFKAKELIDKEKGDRFYLVDYKHFVSRVKVQADAMKIRQQFSVEIFASIQQQMSGCVAHSIIPYLQIDQERYGSENRSLTVMFVSLGVELGSASTPEGMNKIQLIVTEVQKQVYRLQGSVNKLLMDDKGSTLICLWGLLPFAHDDDAARAILAGFNMIKALNRIDGTYCNIGISSGECFSGVVGTSGSRKEFSVLGDIVNLAARIMGTIKVSKAKNEIRCDLNSRLLAGNYFDFQYTQHYELKGKSISMPFYKPSNPYEKYELATKKIVPPEQILNVHVNPLNLERNTEYKIKCKTNSFRDTLDGLVIDITEYFSEDNERDWPFMAVIKGEPGSGKTTFARNLIDDLQNANEFAPFLRANKGKLPIFASAVNAETQLQFLNAWKPIIQMMFIYFCKRMGLKKENFLADILISSRNLDKVDLMCEITGVDKYVMTQKRGASFAQQLREIDQVEPIRTQIGFVQRPDFTKDQKENLIDFLTQLIKCLIGEENEISDWHSFMENSRMKSRDMDNSFMDKPPFMIFIDNAHNMCPTSWLLLQQVLEESYRLVVILLVQSDDMDRMKIDPQSIGIFEQVYDGLVERLDVVEKDLPRLTAEQLSEVIKSYNTRYRQSYKKEMEDMTKIIDYNNTLKDDEMGARQKALLTEKWQLLYTMHQIDEDILRVITTKCRGNPLLCFQYFINLLHNHFIEIQSDGYVMPTSKFDHCMQINDWTAVPVPRLALKTNLQLLDQFYYSIQSKDVKNQRPGELQACTTAIVLLKAASVLGEEFELKALKYISPLSKSGSNTKRVEEAIRLLEQRDFIEIVDETDQKNCVCRFNKCFLRESIYQVLIYKSCKKDLHGATEKFIQQSPALTSKQDNSLLTDQLLQHMLLAQDTEEEKDLLYERRSALVVLRVQNQINKNPRGLVLKDFLYKQGDAINKKVEKRICSLTQFNLKWYHNDEEEFKQDKYMGMVQLPFIYEVIKSKQAHNERPSFMISVTMHYDRKGEEKGKRNVWLSCDTAEMRDKWIIAIDYLKTRAIYEAYAKKNTLANFIAQRNEEEKMDGEDHEERDLSNLLYDFGDQLKSSTNGGTVQNFKSQQLNNRNNSTFISDRKSSIFRSHVNGLESNQKVTAHDLVSRLKVLYKVGMVSFTHHMQRQGFKQKAVIAKTTNGGKQAAEEHQQMQLPTNLNWNIRNDIEDCIGQEPFFNPERHGTQSSSQKGSDYHRDTNSASQQISEPSSGQRRTAQRQKSSDGIKIKNDATRRSSSFSADNMQKTLQNQNLPENPLIKESENESDESEKGFQRNHSKQGLAKKGRQSVQENLSKLDNLQRGVGSMHNNATNKLSLIDYRNSEDSSLTPGSTPPLTGNMMVNQAQPRSSQGLSYSNPTQEKEDNSQHIDANSGDEEGFNHHMVPHTVPENRQTFASSHAGKDSPYHPVESSNKHAHPHHGVSQNQLEEPQSTGDHESSSSTQNFQKTKHRKANSSIQYQAGNNNKMAAPGQGHKTTQSMMSGNQLVGSQQDQTVDSFRQGDSQKEYSTSQRNARSNQLKTHGINQGRAGGDRQPSIGRDPDRKELSMIHHQNQNQYDSRMGDSMIQPLIDVQREKLADDNSISGGAHSASQDSQNQKLISTLSSMIKQQLGQGINDLFSEQKQTMERMEEQQKQIQEQISLQQQQLLNQSFHSQALMHQQQSMIQGGLPQTPTQYTHPQIAGQPTHLVPQSVSALMPQSQYSAMLTTPGHQQASIFSPPIRAGHPYPAHLQHSANPPPQPYYSAFNAVHNQSISEISQGGITSKRSHKHVLDSAAHPIQSKQEQTDDDEPVDPMFEEFAGGQSSARGQAVSRPLLQHELDLRDYNHSVNSASNNRPAASARGYLMHHGHQDQQNVLRSFQVPSTMSQNLMSGQLLSEQDHQSHHTDHEVTVLNHRQPRASVNSTNDAVRTPPMYVNQGAYLTTRQQQQQAAMTQQQQMAALDNQDSASAMTLKPTYPGFSDQLSSRSLKQQHRVKSGFQQQPSDHGNHNKSPGQFSLKQQQVNAYQQQPMPVKFADQPLVFPPPENWTETQYAMYEEPLSSSQYKTMKSVTRATAVRDSYDLRSQQIMIPRNTEVNVLEILPQAQIGKIEYEGRVGIFKLHDFVSKDNSTSQMYQSNNDSINLSLQMATEAKVKPSRTTDKKSKKSFRGMPPGNANAAAAPHRSHQQQEQQFHHNPVEFSGRTSQHNHLPVSIDVHQSSSNAQGHSTSLKQPPSQLESLEGGGIRTTAGPGSKDTYRGLYAGNVGSGTDRVGNSTHRAKKSIHLHSSIHGAGAIQDSTIEQMSSINGIDEEDQDLIATSNNAHKNFFRDDPEKQLSKKMRTLTARELANYSKQFLEEDKAEHIRSNLKMVERQKRKAQIARRQPADGKSSRK